MGRSKLELTIRKPPALNHLYCNDRFGGRHLTSGGSTWKEECVLIIRSMGHDQIIGPVSLLVNLYTCKRQDNDGVLKILMDSLEASEIIPNDYWIFDLRVIKHKCEKEDERVDILLEAINA